MKKLFLSLSALGLLGYSGVVLAQYKGDCLEMKCTWGCKEDSTGKAVDGRCCPEPTRTNCIAEQREEFGCVTAKKIDCATVSPETPVCSSDGTCVAEAKTCRNWTECPEGETCDTKTKTCQPCPEPKNTSCLIKKDTVSANCVVTKKVDCAVISPETPICYSGDEVVNKALLRTSPVRTGTCVECERDEDCADGFCNPQTMQCQNCPTTRLPTYGRPCTKGCGCATGLSCVFEEETICGYKGVCKYTCETNSDCSRGEYCAFENYEGQCTKGYGECKPNSDKKTKKGYLISKEPMTWWSAQNWCESHGKTLVDYNFDCYGKEVSGFSLPSASSELLNNLSNNGYGFCCNSGKNPGETNQCLSKQTVNMPQKMRQLRSNLKGALPNDESCFWTSHQTDSCYAYTIGFKANQIWNTPLTGKQKLPTAEPNHMHALCQ